MQDGGGFEAVKIEQVFTVSSSIKKFNANTVSFDGQYPYVARGSSNNGIRGYINENTKFLNKGKTISFGQDTATMFYQEEPYFTGDKIKIMDCKIKELTPKIATFLITAMQKAFVNFSWGSSSFNEKILNNVQITLPTKNGQIAFDYMEDYIEELQDERIAELQAYLEVTGLSDYSLSNAEINALDTFNGGSLAWREFRIEDVLIWQNNIKEIDPKKLSFLTDLTEPKYSFYGQSTTNNGVISKEQLTRKVLNNKEGKPTILIHSNNQHTVYLEEPFYLKDGHGATSVLQSENLNEKIALFMMSSIKKVINEKYSYAAKATKIALKNTNIKLPTTPSGEIDFEFMQSLIKAVEKQAIKGVVEFKDKIISETKKVVLN